MIQMLTTRHRGARGARGRIESERSTKAKQHVFNGRSCFRPCNPVNVRRITRDTDRVRSVPSSAIRNDHLSYIVPSYLWKR